MAGAHLVAHCGLQLAAPQRCAGVGGALAVQCVQRLQRSVDLLALLQRTDQRGVGRRAGVGRGDSAQLGKHLGIGPLAQARCGDDRAQADVGGVEAGQPGEQGVGRQGLAIGRAYQGGQRQHVAGSAWGVDQRGQRQQGLVGLAQPHLGLGQQAAGGGVLRHQRRGLGQVGLGLQGGLQPQLVLTGGHEQDEVVRPGPQQVLVQLAGLGVPALGKGQPGFQQPSAGVLGGHLAQAGPLRAGGVDLAIGQQLCHQGGAGIGLLRPGLDRSGEGGDGVIMPPGQVQQQVALDRPGLVVERFVGQQAVQQLQGGIAVAVGHGQTDLHQPGRR